MPAKKKTTRKKTTAKRRPARKKTSCCDVSDEQVERAIENKITSWAKCCGSKAKNKATPSGCGCGGFAYFVAWIGALVYYLTTATGFWNGVLGVLKSIIWPAFLVFELLKSLGM